MEVKPLSQRDPRWKNKKLGFSNYTLGTHGCTVTALTCLLNYLEGTNYTPDYVNDRLRAVKAFSDGKNIGKGALVVWYRVAMAFPSLRWIKRAVNYSNLEVAWYVYGRQLPVMVEVNASKIGAPRHWVLYIGDRKMVDPWTGTIKATSTYPATGYSLYQRA